MGSAVSGSPQVSCSAGQPISITCMRSLASSTRWRMVDGCRKQSPSCSSIGSPWSSYATLHPTPVAVDHLEADVVEVHVVGHRPALGDEDVRGDEPTTEATGDQVAVAHAGATFAERVVGRLARGHAGDDELLLAAAGTSSGGLAGTNSTIVPFGAVTSPGSPSVVSRRRRAGRGCAADLQANGEAVALQHRHARVIGGHDRAHLEPDAGEEVDGGGDRLACRAARPAPTRWWESLMSPRAYARSSAGSSPAATTTRSSSDDRAVAHRQVEVAGGEAAGESRWRRWSRRSCPRTPAPPCPRSRACRRAATSPSVPAGSCPSRRGWWRSSRGRRTR